ncbi:MULTISPECIES: hypothetical protein [unclassified Beijerinckia]|uniref:hypothetical protein n=1 Tax=unclassified Beijerinckia TaxID=2638183 RepID=UPI001FCDF741|nr:MULTISPECIES: hypothetical protein [unclassified Beijerinckia]
MGAAVLAGPACATDEIQVYNAEIAEPGQLTIQQHANFVRFGGKTPALPGALVSNGSVNGTPELAYGVNDWWELGFYMPFSIQDKQYWSDGFKLRTLFVSPHAEQRNFFYGINFEFSNSTPRFSQTQTGLEVRPIIGVRNADYEFIVNPIVDIGFGKHGEADFAPAARLARNLDKDLLVGVEYYGDLGRIGHFDKLSQQQHTLFAVADFKVGKFDVDVGVGWGLTKASDHLVFKLILGYAFPVPGQNQSATPVPASFGPATTTAPSQRRGFQFSRLMP